MAIAHPTIEELKALEEFCTALNVAFSKSEKELLAFYNQSYSTWDQYLQQWNDDELTDEHKRQKIEDNYDRYSELFTDKEIDDQQKIATIYKYIYCYYWKRLSSTIEPARIKQLFTSLSQPSGVRTKLYASEDIAEMITNFSNGDVNRQERNFIQLISSEIKKQHPQEISYTTEEAIIQGTRTDGPLYYDTFSEMSPFTRIIREDFDKENGAKHQFLSLLGAFLECGQELNKNPNNSRNAVNRCIEFLNGVFRNHKIEDILKIRSPNLDKFIEEKSKSLYYKLVTATLIEKLKNDPLYNAPDTFVEVIIPEYIAELKKGNNDVQNFQFSNGRSAQEIKAQNIEDQLISIHHKEPPIGAVLDLYLRNHPDLHKLEQFYLLYEKCCGNISKAAIERYKYNHRQNNSSQNLPDAVIKNRIIFQRLKLGFAHLIFPEAKPQRGSYFLTPKEQLLYNNCVTTLNSDETNKIRTEILELVNNLPNLTLAITQEAHQKMESEGILTIKPSPDRTCLATYYSSSQFNSLCDKLKIYPKLYSILSGIKKYALPRNSKTPQLITVSLIFAQDNLRSYRPPQTLKQKKPFSIKDIFNSDLFEY